MQKLGKDWIWIGLGVAAIFATIGLIKPVNKLITDVSSASGITPLANFNNTVTDVLNSDLKGFNKWVKDAWHNITVWI